VGGEKTHNTSNTYQHKSKHEKQLRTPKADQSCAQVSDRQAKRNETKRNETKRNETKRTTPPRMMAWHDGVA
jgi:hypothetical protein